MEPDAGQPCVRWPGWAGTPACWTQQPCCRCPGHRAHVNRRTAHGAQLMPPLTCVNDSAHLDVLHEVRWGGGEVGRWARGWRCLMPLTRQHCCAVQHAGRQRATGTVPTAQANRATQPSCWRCPPGLACTHPSGCHHVAHPPHGQHPYSTLMAATATAIAALFCPTQLSSSSVPAPAFPLPALSPAHTPPAPQSSPERARQGRAGQGKSRQGSWGGS